ncbi:unnamed protein product [Danaus chrysippus]|uniref:Cilia- and flagella-associated protein 36 n=1 Tax=Danaus chrysippus TaxID=151541 RepID=A0A8J2QNN1_9NEOP|nr:unnamed protein product [Danaus chrysippus]
MENLDNNSWVFDSLVGFLHGPVWNIPLQTFIEEKSLPFEPTDDGEVIDKPEYKKIHDEYRNLVDVMLGSFMDDIGISADQFEGACRLSAHDLAGLPSYFHKRLFEQIWAANDYEMFVKMMTHKNVELQLQALELIEKRYGILPNLFNEESENLDSSGSTENSDWADSDDVMTEIKKLHLDDFEVKDEITVPKEEVVAQKQTLLTQLQHFENIEESSPKQDTEKKLKEVEPLNKIMIPTKTEVSEEDIRERQEYLKQQRDKLLAMKKQVREKKLGSLQNEGAGEGLSHSARPRSARAAQAALAGNTPQPASDAMLMRKALASKLKTEVVNKQL